MMCPKQRSPFKGKVAIVASSDEVSSSLANFRLGRQNSPKGRGAATRNERYDYEYSEDELREWVEPITNVSKYTEQTYVYFNNHYRGKAAKNAAMLDALLKKAARPG